MDFIDVRRLTDEQRRLVHLTNEGQHVVLGPPGSGKTTLAMHRAIALQRTLAPLPTDLVAVSKTLVNAIDNVPGIGRSGVEVRTFHGLVGRVFWDNDEPLALTDGEWRKQAIGAARWAAPNSSDVLSGKSDGFFVEEFSWIQGAGIATRDKYLSAERVGRWPALGENHRQFVWRVYQEYLRSRPAGSTDYAEAGSRLLQLATARRLPPRHIVVDEAHELSPQNLRALAALATKQGSLTLFGDSGRGLDSQRVSLRSLGLEVRRVHRLTTNHRTSPQIGKWATHLLNSRWLATANAGNPPIHLGLDGPLPERKASGDSAERADWAASLAQAWTDDGCRVGVLTRENEQAEALRERLGTDAAVLDRDTDFSRPHPLLVGTIHSAAGQTFDGVILPFSGAADLPPAPATASLGARAAMEQEARLLYVGATRARSRLAFGALDEFSPILPSDTLLYA